MLEKSVQDKLIQKGRDFMKGYRQDDAIVDQFQSDQDLKLPQPPLVKAPIKPKSEWIQLSLNFDQLQIESDLQKVIRDRRSARIYTQEPMISWSCLSCYGPLRVLRAFVEKAMQPCAQCLVVVPDTSTKHTY